MEPNITNEELNKIIKKVTKEVLNEYRMMNANQNEGEYNYNQVSVHIFPNDHYPPHFHVTKGTNFEYNLKFRIDNGKLIEDLSKDGTNKKVKKKIIKSAIPWLNDISPITNTTNREACIDEWNKYNPSKPYIEGLKGY